MNLNANATMKRLAAVCGLVALLAAPGAALAQAESFRIVAMFDVEYVPSVLSVQPGTTVTWINEGWSQHTATTRPVPAGGLPAVVEAFRKEEPLMHRLSLPVGLLSLTLMLMAPAFAAPAIVSAQDDAASGTATVTHYILPFTAEGPHPNLAATATEEAICSVSSSVAIGRPDAWSCFGEGSQVYDPCFENPFLPPDEQTELVCFESPFTSDVVFVTLVEPLVREKEAVDPVVPDPLADAGAIGPWELPWALELANGDRCTLLRGTLTVMAGHVVHYGCVDQGLVLGEVDDDHPVWTVHYLADDDFSSGPVDVVAAWS